MGFFHTLESTTRPDADALFRIPFVTAAVTGSLTREQYVAFLTQAYHHVKHTVPLLMATGAALPERLEWLREAVGAYIDEEMGHQEWILADIAACGADAEAVRRGSPDRPCDVLVAYAYDLIHRRHPVGFFGMVHVLEGTSVRGATQAAHALRAKLGLPAEAFTYLTTHGELDQGHVGFFARLMDRLDDPEDRAAVLSCAKTFFALYGDVFRGLEPTAQGGAA